MAIFKKVNRDLQSVSETVPGHRHTVLLVDDEPDNLSVLSAILGSRYRILQACDGQEALELVKAMDQMDKLTLVVSDQRMPRLTGVQLCEQLCILSPDTVRIILTGHIDTEAIVDSINRAQIHKFVLKPFDRVDLELTVKHSVEAFEAKRKLADYVLNLESKVHQHTLQLQQHQDELVQLSSTDPLTGLNTRAHLLEVIGKDVAIAQRAHKNVGGDGVPNAAIANASDLLFFLIDCDNFTQINEQHAPEVGDQLLCAISKVLRQVFRGSDHVVRWGNSQFLVVARFAARSRCAELAERTRAALKEISVPASESQATGSFSIGYAALPFVVGLPEPLAWQQVLNRADCALYCAQQNGPNAWVGLIAGAQASAEPLEHYREIPALIARGLLRVEASCAPDHLRWV